MIKRNKSRQCGIRFLYKNYDGGTGKAQRITWNLYILGYFNDIQ